MKQLTDNDKRLIAAHAMPGYASDDFCDVFLDLCDRAFTIYDDREGGDLYDIASDAIDNGLIYSADQWAVLRQYSADVASADWGDACEGLQRDIVKALEEYEEAIED